MSASKHSLFTGSSQQLDESLNSSGDEDKNGNNKAIAREKQLKKVDKWTCPTPSLPLRGRPTRGRVALLPPLSSSRSGWGKLIKKYGGNIFSETRLDDGLHSIVEKNEPTEEKDIAKQQRLVGSMAHLALQDLRTSLSSTRD